MKALVIGATGIIGNHVVRSLLAEGVAVRAFSRGVTASVNLEGLDVEIVRGDLNDAGSVQKAIQGCDWVFHTASYYPAHTFDVKGHVQAAMKGVNAVLDAVSSSSIQRFVFTSSLTTIGPPRVKGALADESCAYTLQGKPPHPYFEVKHLMEEEVKRLALAGFPAVIVNPTGCFGPYELKPPQLCFVPALVNGKVPAYVDCPINAVDVADVGRGHVLAAKKGRVGERYILGGHNVTSEMLVKTICNIAGVSPPKLKVPVSLGLVPAWASEVVDHFILGRAPQLPILGLRFLQYGQHFNLEKSKQELGCTVSPLEPCFERAIKWFKKIGYC